MQTSQIHEGIPLESLVIPEGEPYVNIHHYFTNPKTGENVFDEHGELMLGWYWQIMDAAHIPLSHVTGPYNDETEAQNAACEAWLAEAY